MLHGGGNIRQKIQYQLETRTLDLIVMNLAAAVYQAWNNFLP